MSGSSTAPSGRAGRPRIEPFALLVVLVALFPAAPLLQPGYFWEAHDARHSVYFLFELDQGIQDGILYPRWQPDFAFGYGYPMFNIYGPLSSYLGEAFHLVGFGFADSVKIVFGLSLVLSGLAMYGFVRRAIGRRAGLVAAVAYMVVPYRLVDIYVRAALAESVAYVLVPLVLWGAWSAVERPSVRCVVGLALAFAVLTFTHPLTALLLSVILAAFAVVLALAQVSRDQPFREMSRQSLLPWMGHLGHRLIPAGAGLLLGLGLSAAFLLPAMTENRFVRLDQWYGGRYAWGGDFVAFFQLFSPRWGFGFSAPGPNDDMSFQLGAVPLVLSLFGVLATWPWVRGRDGPPGAPARLVLFFAGLGSAAVFLMLPSSSAAWHWLPLARLVQFPWRLLSVAVVALAFLSGAVLGREKTERPWPGAVTLLVVSLLVLGSVPFLRAPMSERQVSMAELMKFQQSADEMTGSTAWVKTIPHWSSMADYYVAGEPVTSKINYGLFYQQAGAEARTVELRTQQELIEYLAPEPMQITFDRFYYPGWTAYLVDVESGSVLRELPITRRGELGLITVEVPAGLGRVLLRFEDTPVRSAGEAVSLLSLLVAAALLAGPGLLRLRKSRADRAGGRA